MPIQFTQTKPPGTTMYNKQDGEMYLDECIYRYTYTSPPFPKQGLIELLSGGGGGGHCLFELGYQLRNYSPLTWTKDNPYFYTSKFIAPSFHGCPKDSFLKSTLNDEFSIISI